MFKRVVVLTDPPEEIIPVNDSDDDHPCTKECEARKRRKNIDIILLMLMVQHGEIEDRIVSRIDREEEKSKEMVVFRVFFLMLRQW
jgi:hypothetical protein